MQRRSRWKAAVWLAGLICLSATTEVHAISFPNLLSSFDVLETVAGTALITPGGANGWDDSMEGEPATTVELSRPHMAMADWQGNIYIADKDAHAIRRVGPDGILTTVAGTNEPGYNGASGLGTEVQLNQPNGLYTFPNGTTYIYDLGNSAIRRLSTDGQLTTVFDDPWGTTVGRGLWVSPDESLVYYSSGEEIRRWTPDEGVSLYASGFVALGNLTVDPSDGTVVATDRGGNAVYRVYSDGTSERIAGNLTPDGGGSGLPALQTGLDEVRGIYFHPDGGYLLATHDGGQVWFVDDSDIIHLLIHGGDNGEHAGDGLPLSSPGKKISEPRAVVLGPNGDLIVTEHDGGYIRRAKALDPWVMGDFDTNRTLDILDLEQLEAAIEGQRHPQTMDVNFDGLVNSVDRDTWIRELKHTYYGDANLDGEFNSQDFVQVFQFGEYEDEIDGNSTWAEGDWNGDDDFNSTDFVLAFQDGGYEQGPRLSVAVPEPSTSLLVWFAAATLLRYRKSREIG